MLPICSGGVKPRSREDVTLADERLGQALEGQRVLVVDGAMGTMLQVAGVDVTSSTPDLLCLHEPELVESIHRAYVQAGAEVITTNTFSSNARTLGGAASVEEVYAVAVACARRAGAPYVAADIGPLGALLQPLGDLSCQDAYELFAQQVRAARKAGADLIIIETMTDIAEACIAVLAAKENCKLPVFATLTFDEAGHTLMGTDPAVAARVLDAMGVQALGLNCSLGPDKVAPFVEQMVRASTCPVIAQPNAGLPQSVDGQMVYALSPESYVEADRDIVAAGATVLGSCCGSTPAFTARIKSTFGAVSPHVGQRAQGTYITSSREELCIDDLDIETASVCLNADGDNDPDLIADAVFDSMQEDARLLSLQVDGMEEQEIVDLVRHIASVTAKPLWFKGTDETALEAAARFYPGVALLGKKAVSPTSLLTEIAAHYGCKLV